MKPRISNTLQVPSGGLKWFAYTERYILSLQGDIWNFELPIQGVNPVLFFFL